MEGQTGRYGCKEFEKNYTEDDKLYWYWLLNIPGVGSVYRRNLLEVFGYPEAVYCCSEKELGEVIPANKARSLLQAKDLTSFRRSLQELEKRGIRFISWDSPDYPFRLRHIYEPPLGLYLIGRLPDFRKPVLAVVGSRKATVYGLRQAYGISRDLASQGVQIISGLASGIDGAGHRGALEGGGYSLGVLGGGIDTMYPQENFNLYRDLYQRGGVLSEYNAGIPNHKGLFPQRNRIISGLSDGVFVVQAGKHSGSLITADLGLNQGKTIFALPGRITDNNSIGTNRLIAQGAVMVNGPEDILEELYPAGMPQPFYDSPLDSCLTENEKLVISFLGDEEPVSYDRLSEICPLDGSNLRHTLIELELKGFLCQPEKNIFCKNYFLKRI